MKLKARLPPCHAITSSLGTKSIVIDLDPSLKMEPLLCGTDEQMLFLDSYTLSDSRILERLLGWMMIVKIYKIQCLPFRTSFT